MYEDPADALRGFQLALFGGTPDETPEATAPERRGNRSSIRS
jgi:hypothetical protein